MNKCMLTALTVLMLTVGCSIQSCTFPFWVNSFPKGSGGPYFISLWLSLMLALFFGLAYLIYSRGRKTVPTRKYMADYLVQAGSCVINTLLLSYCSPPERTPPILYSIMINMGIFSGLMLTKMLIPTKKHIEYCNRHVLISLGCLCMSIVVSLVGNILAKNINNTEFKLETLLWLSLMLITTFFSSLYNVMQQLYLLNSNKELETQDHNANLLKTLFYSSLFQPFITCCFFWLEFIPGFGYSTTVSQLVVNLRINIQCFFTVGCGVSCLLYGLLVTFSGLMVFVGTMILNKDSANFSILSLTLQTPFSVLVFMLTGLGTENTPVWTVIISMIFLTTGIIVWKRWEMAVQKQQIEQKLAEQPINSQFQSLIN